jgi:hypothetical protein
LKSFVRFFFLIIPTLFEVVQAQSTFDSIVKPKKFMGFVPLSDTISEDKKDKASTSQEASSGSEETIKKTSSFKDSSQPDVLQL